MKQRQSFRGSHQQQSNSASDPMSMITSTSEIKRMMLEYAKSGTTELPGVIAFEEPGLTKALIQIKSDALAKHLATEISDGKYHFKPARVRVVGGETEVLLPLSDVIVLRLLGNALKSACFSSIWRLALGRASAATVARSVNGISRMLKEHKKKHWEVERRGLFVLRRICTDPHKVITPDETSSYWPLLESAVKRSIPQPDKAKIFVELVKDHLRHSVIENSNITLPHWSPVSDVVISLALSPVDKLLTKDKNLFASRIDGNIVIFSQTKDVLENLAQSLDAAISKCSLKVDNKSSGIFYLTPSGLPHPELKDVEPRRSFGYLGAKLYADGEVSVNTHELDDLLESISKHAQDAAKTFRESQNYTDAAKAAVKSTNLILTDKIKVHGNKALWILPTVTNRSDLKDLDFQIAKSVIRFINPKKESKKSDALSKSFQATTSAEKATNNDEAKSDLISLKSIMKDYGLLSLLSRSAPKIETIATSPRPNRDNRRPMRGKSGRNYGKEREAASKS